MTMKPRPYADEKLLETYPGIHLTDEDKRKIDESTVVIPELLSRGDLILYGVGQALSAMVTLFFRKLEEITDERTALDLAYQLGLEHGNANYGRFLRNRGLPGGPESMCEYQDFGHGVRGPRHARALFAVHDDNAVLVKRTDCLYFWGMRGEPNRYVETLEKGIVEGYKQVDPRLDHVENPRCLCKGSAEGCEHRFVFKTGS